MAAYSWTQDYVLDHLTLPQVMLWFRCMEKYPPINVLAPALLKSFTKTDKKKLENLGELGGAIAEGNRSSGGIQLVSKGKMSELINKLGRSE